MYALIRVLLVARAPIITVSTGTSVEYAGRLRPGP